MSLVLLTLGLLCAPSAQAQQYPGGGPAGPPGNGLVGGHYVPSYQGGTFQTTSSDGTVTNGDDGPKTDNKGNLAWGCSFLFGPSSAVNCEGAITTTLTWQPDPSTPNAPPPTSVLVEEDCTFMTYTSQGVTGMVNTDLGNSGDGGGAAPARRLTLKNNPGQSFVLDPPCAPTLSLASSPASGYSGGSLTYSVTVGPDPNRRRVTIYRDNAHNETTDGDGTVHGDTRYSYAAGSGLGDQTVWNTQVFHSYFIGSWSDPSGQWSPQGFSPPDTVDTHSQLVDVGSIMADGTPQQWYGKPDAAKPLTITYTATDSDGASASAKYILTIHDEYENWHRVSSQGGPIDPNAKGDHGSLVPLATGDCFVPGTVVLSVPATPVEWNTDESVGGGFVAGAGAACILVGKIPAWGGVLLTLAGLALQTAASVPPDATNLSPPDQFTETFFEAAYQNTETNQTAQPGQGEDDTNVIDISLFHLLQQNPDFVRYFKGDYGRVSVTTKLYAQMLNYYFQADKYDNGGFLTHNSPGAATVPGGNVWYYLWHCAGAPQNPSTPNQPPS